MPGPETQTFDTAGGQAAPAQEQPQEVMLPPQIAQAIDQLRGAQKRLRKQFKPQDAAGKALKQELTNYLLPQVEATLLILSQAFVETYQLFSYMQADFTQLREHVLANMGGAPLVDGNVSEEQIAATRRAFAQMGLLLAQPELDHEQLNEAFSELLACFNDLLDIDLAPYDDEAGDAGDDEEVAANDADEPPPSDGAAPTES